MNESDNRPLQIAENGVSCSKSMERSTIERWMPIFSHGVARVVILFGLTALLAATAGNSVCDEPETKLAERQFADGGAVVISGAANAGQTKPQWVGRCRTLRHCAETKWRFIRERWAEERVVSNGGEQAAAKQRMLQDLADVSRRVNELLLGEVTPHAADSRAIETLIWIVNTRDPKSVQPALDLLTTYHLAGQETIELAIRNERSPMRWVDPLLTKLLHRLDADHFRRPRILLALANHKQSDSQLPAQLAFATDTELNELDLLYGKETITDCRRINAPEKERQAIELFRQLEQQYGSQPAAQAMTFGELATAAIFEMKNLAIGKVAPDLEGEDLDGKSLKLSDYRGKVVMLSFWGAWCGPCMAHIPQDRELVKKFSGKPFVLLGVNSDPDKKQLRDEIVRHEISWRSLWCGPKGVDGEIPRRWNINGWPTLYVLDHRGVIRAKDPSGPALEQLLEKLTAEAAKR